MNKKAISAVIAALLLIGLAVILATIIYVSSTKLLQFSPPPEEFCSKLQFNVEIYKDVGKYYLASVNLGNTALEGFSIKEVSQGATKNREEVSLNVQPGKTEKAQLTLIILADENKELLVVPKVSVGDSIELCANEFGKSTKVKSS